MKNAEGGGGGDEEREDEVPRGVEGGNKQTKKTERKPLVCFAGAQRGEKPEERRNESSGVV